MKRSTAIPLGTLAVALLVAVAVLVTSGSSDDGGGTSSATRTSAASAPTALRLEDQQGLSQREEIADVRAGIVLYTDTRGTQADAASIPIGRTVKVACLAPNESGIASINSFYLIASAPWRGLFASANQFANGAPVGVTTNAHRQDPRVPHCRRR